MKLHSKCSLDLQNTITCLESRIQMCVHLEDISHLNRNTILQIIKDKIFTKDYLYYIVCLFPYNILWNIIKP